MRSIIQKHRWSLFCLVAIIMQTIFTMNHLKFFPFSDHGVFETYLNIHGQKFYRVKLKKTDHHYQEEGILYERTREISHQVHQYQTEPQKLNNYFESKNIYAVDEFHLFIQENGKLFDKKRIYERN